MNSRMRVRVPKNIRQRSREFTEDDLNLARLINDFFDKAADKMIKDWINIVYLKQY